MKLLPLAAFLALILVVLITGWVQNLNALTKCDFKAPYKCEVIRAVGILPPIGAVIGYMEIKDD